MKSLNDLIADMDLTPVDEIDRPNRSDQPWITHEGVLIFDDIELDVIELNTGERMITEGCIHRIFGTMGGEIL